MRAFTLLCHLLLATFSLKSASGWDNSLTFQAKSSNQLNNCYNISLSHTNATVLSGATGISSTFVSQATSYPYITIAGLISEICKGVNENWYMKSNYVNDDKEHTCRASKVTLDENSVPACKAALTEYANSMFLEMNDNGDGPIAIPVTDESGGEIVYFIPKSLSPIDIYDGSNVFCDLTRKQSWSLKRSGLNVIIR